MKKIPTPVPATPPSVQDKGENAALAIVYYEVIIMLRLRFSYFSYFVACLLFYRASGAV